MRIEQILMGPVGEKNFLRSPLPAFAFPMIQGVHEVGILDVARRDLAFDQKKHGFDLSRRKPKLLQGIADVRQPFEKESQTGNGLVAWILEAQLVDAEPG